MDMIINGVAGVAALTIVATFVAQVLAPRRRSALWAARAAAPCLHPASASLKIPSSPGIDVASPHHTARSADSAMQRAIAA